MQIIRQNSDNLVMYAGADLSESDLANLGAGWCDERVTPTLATAINVASLPVGFVPDCWTYVAGTWTVVAEKQEQVDIRIGMPTITSPTLSVDRIITGAALSPDGITRAYVDIDWDAVATATTYEIRYKLASESIWSIWSVTGENSANTEYRIEGLAPESSYQFAIRANCLWGMSDWSASVAVTTASPSTVPVDADGFTATPNKSFVDLVWLPSTDAITIGYEIRLGTSWDDGEVLVTNHLSTRFSWQPTQTGNLQFWVKGVDVRGNYSATAATALITINSASISGLSQQVIDNNVLLSWTINQGTFAIDHVEVRRGLDFGTADVIGNMSGTFTTVFETASSTYKYWVVPKDISGLYGVEAGVYAVVNQPPDFVLQDSRSFAFTGTFTNCLVENGKLVAPVNTTETYQAHFTTHSWTTPQNQIDAGYPRYIQPPPATASYVETIDYVATIPNTKIAVALTKTAVVGTVTITPTISVSLDNSTWTDYAGVYEVYATNFRYIKVSLAFSTANSGVVTLDATNVSLSVKNKTIQGKTAVLSSDSGGTSVDITGIFLDVQAINLTPLATTACIAVYDFTDVPNPTAFKILLFNTAGTRISGTVSWSVRGV